jgi:hypothetical protein
LTAHANSIPFAHFDCTNPISTIRQKKHHACSPVGRCHSRDGAAGGAGFSVNEVIGQRHCDSGLLSLAVANTHCGLLNCNAKAASVCRRTIPRRSSVEKG